jgi:hypothetical protein
MKVQRAMGSLIKILGGWRTYDEPDIVEESNEEESDE